MMEELLKEYEYQEYQLNKIHGTLTLLELGYNSLKQELSVTECSASYLLGQVRGDAEALEEHGEQMEMAVDEIATCLEETCEALDRVEELVRVHPCGEGVWRTVALEDYTDPSTPCPPAWEEVIDPASGGRFCGNTSVSTSFAIPDGGEYSRVCGRVRAVQFGQASAFRFGGNGLDSTYMSGVSITHGEPP